jgi:hypothetical protein
MPRLIIWLPPDKGELLKQVAQAERRDPRQQARLYIERELSKQLKRKGAPMTP